MIVKVIMAERAHLSRRTFPLSFEADKIVSRF